MSGGRKAKVKAKPSPWVLVFCGNPFTGSERLVRTIWMANKARRSVRVTSDGINTITVEMRVPVPKSLRGVRP